MFQMQPKPIQLTDWHRILAGGTPWTFLLEVMLWLSIVASRSGLSRAAASNYSRRATWASF